MPAFLSGNAEPIGKVFHWVGALLEKHSGILFPFLPGNLALRPDSEGGIQPATQT